MKNLKFSCLLMLIVVMASCCTSCDYEYTDEDYLVGDTWYWTKSVHMVEERHHWVDDYVEYAKEDVMYKFYRNGDLQIKTRIVSHFGRVYEDWIDGSWDLRGPDLIMNTRDGKWTYEIQELSNWEMVLVYYQDVYDDFGHFLYQEKVEEYFER